MLDNLRVAWTLKDIGDLLKIKGDNYFKIKSYYDVSKLIRNLDEDINDLLIEDRLEELEGVGSGLAATIEEILTEGSCAKYEELKAELPLGLLDILDLSGVGPKKVKQFYEELEIDSLEKLAQAARQRELRKLPGIGSKTEAKITDAIKRSEGKGQENQINLAIATDLANELIDICTKLSSVNEAEITGSLRRKEELIEQIDLLLATESPAELLAFLSELPLVTSLTEEEDRVKLTSRLDIEIEVLFTELESFSCELLRSTGTEHHYTKLKELAAQRGYELSSSSLYNKSIAEDEVVNSEEEIYQRLKLPYIIPEIRDGKEEIELALQDDLPVKLEVADIKGDLHLHTNWSDGASTIREMAVAGQERGYEYLAICDHSRSLGVAGGLKVAELKRQLEEIDRTNEQLSDFQILKGSEVDILADGSLDYDSRLLEQLDIVVASIHSGFRQSKQKQTQRIITALENEQVDILGHPTGRLLPKRDPYPVDIEVIIAKAAETDTILEVNASPERLDLSSEHLRLAKEAGVKIAINTDAHSVEQLDNVRFGVYNVRKGLIGPQEVVNTYSLAQLREILAT
ncbi:DNA polymerase/3'-5' exonuclease PolX [Fuchsiella alkaliacetigena]|uniref:DNA polymerase/3'-5' exonuclease PolX n=1 Tax=Fuchsiella alkaliacetigena TaxID=957042 RepID=UPI00200B47EA|nr:DNA polymerase/3'-5' exonuclease PolX [Fuchsiella alkaliacetigena]MCK8825989.1 DNA polymerase/3'-5' exonuclease PolX [Fuchsiella alkaliacetigena]